MMMIISHNNYNSIKYFLYVLISQSKGQLQNTHEQRKERNTQDIFYHLANNSNSINVICELFNSSSSPLHGIGREAGPDFKNAFHIL
jgi:hypothetical protein